MEQEKFYFRVGVFVSFTIAMLITVLTWFATSSYRQGTTPYAIYFDVAVNGLSLGSNVELKGINVGTVREIGFAPDKSGQIMVLADIISSAPIRNDTVATLRIKGITGTSLISLDNTDEDATPLAKKEGEKYPVIKSKLSGLEKVFTSMPELIDELTKLGVQGQKLLSDENIKAVNLMLTDLRGMLAEGKVTMREVKMLAKTLREDPSQILHGSEYKGYEVAK